MQALKSEVWTRSVAQEGPPRMTAFMHVQPLPEITGTSRTDPFRPAHLVCGPTLCAGAAAVGRKCGGCPDSRRARRRPLAALKGPLSGRVQPAAPRVPPQAGARGVAGLEPGSGGVRGPRVSPRFCAPCRGSLPFPSEKPASCRWSSRGTHSEYGREGRGRRVRRPEQPLQAGGRGRLVGCAS